MLALPVIFQWPWSIGFVVVVAVVMMWLILRGHL